MSESDTRTAARALRERLVAAGCFEPVPGRILRDWAVQLALGFGGLGALALGDSLILRAAGLAVSSFGFLGAATIAHTASHEAVSASRRVNKLVTFVTYPLVLALSATYWHRSHVQVHHPSPNVVDVDDDADLLPLFALNEAHAESPGVPQPLRRAAGFLLPLLLPLNAFGIQVQGWSHLFGELRKEPARRQRGVWLDLACMVLHYTLWLALPMLWLSPALVLGLYALRHAIFGYGLFAILAPGHFPAEARCLDPSLRGEGFFERQTEACLDFRTSWLGNRLCSGLEYQIEHHLFPTIPHPHLPRAQAIVRAFCEEQGLPHRTLGWAEGIWKSYLVFFNPKPVVGRVPQASEREVASEEPRAALSLPPAG